MLATSRICAPPLKQQFALCCTFIGSLGAPSLRAGAGRDFHERQRGPDAAYLRGTGTSMLGMAAGNIVTMRYTF